jgi:hypothetical protein
MALQLLATHSVHRALCTSQVERQIVAATNSRSAEKAKANLNGAAFAAFDASAASLVAATAWK